MSPVFDSPVKKNKVELHRCECVLNVNELLREDDDDQSNRCTDAQIMSQQMREFTRLLAKGQDEKR